MINIELLRKDNIFAKITYFLRKNNRHLLFFDQDDINVVCNDKIGFFPKNTVSSGFCKYNEIKQINKDKYYNHTLIENLKNPYVFHFVTYKKPWFGIAERDKHICFDYFTRFYVFARKTSYYFEILEKFPVFSFILFKAK